MTSKFSIDNRELLQRISSGEAVVGIDFGNLIVRELAAFRLAAMDSESECLPLDYLQGHKDGLEWAAQLAEANHPETGDWLYDDPIELAKAIRKGPDMPPSQPALDTEPVAYTDERNLGYIDRGRETAYLWGKQNSEASDVALYRHAQQEPDVGVYTELYQLREDIKGPDGFDTWKDAAIEERKARVELEKEFQRVVNIDYLCAMAAFHSDQWHKMGPITGYMHGWNACRAAMLAAAPQEAINALISVVSRNEPEGK